MLQRPIHDRYPVANLSIAFRTFIRVVSSLVVLLANGFYPIEARKDNAWWNNTIKPLVRKTTALSSLYAVQYITPIKLSKSTTSNTTDRNQTRWPGLPDSSGKTFHHHHCSGTLHPSWSGRLVLTSLLSCKSFVVGGHRISFGDECGAVGIILLEHRLRRSSFT